jgi:hypothetical protein
MAFADQAGPRNGNPYRSGHRQAPNSQTVTRPALPRIACMTRPGCLDSLAR